MWRQTVLDSGNTTCIESCALRVLPAADFLQIRILSVRFVISCPNHLQNGENHHEHRTNSARHPKRNCPGGIRRRLSYFWQCFKNHRRREKDERNGNQTEGRTRHPAIANPARSSNHIALKPAAIGTCDRFTPILECLLQMCLRLLLGNFKTTWQAKCIPARAPLDFIFIHESTCFALDSLDCRPTCFHRFDERVSNVQEKINRHWYFLVRKRERAF